MDPHRVGQVEGHQRQLAREHRRQVLHGLDLLGRERPFDLMLAGPNNGWSLGQLTLFSGVVGAAQVALRRGVPAIALSMAFGETDHAAAAAHAATLIRALTASSNAFMGGTALPHASAVRVLPRGLGLNVNLPRCERVLGVAITRVGDWAPWHLGFVESMDRFARVDSCNFCAPGAVILRLRDAGSPCVSRLRPAKPCFAKGGSI